MPHRRGCRAGGPFGTLVGMGGLLRLGCALSVIVVGCGGNSGRTGSEGSGIASAGTDSSAATDGMSGPNDGTVSDGTETAADEGGVKFDVGGGDTDADGTTLGCSADLKRVVNQDSGLVVQVCPPDQGCFEGQCIPACDAAAGAQGSIGCDYWVPTSPFYANGSPGASQSGPCHALLVANTWDRPAMLELERDGITYDAHLVTRIPSGVTTNTSYAPLPNDGIPTGQVAVVFLSHRPGVNNLTSLECPITPAVQADTATHGTSQGTAFAFHSDTPVQVYDIIPYGGASSYLPSASLIYPHTAWGTEYLAVSPHTQSNGNWMLAVAAENGTTVEIQPNVAFNNGSIQNPPPNQVTAYQVNAGQVLQWSGPSDLTGSILKADKPIGVFTGNPYLLVHTADNPSSGQDSAHQQITDVNALGNEFIGPGLYSRLGGLAPESVLYRIVGVVEGTQLTWDPAPPAGAPAAVSVGQIVEFQSRELFSVRSQDEDHPFALTQYMSGTLSGQPGCGTNPNSNCTLGDDEWVVLVPPQQFLRHYAFFVDPTYGTSTLVITRTRGPSGFADVELACMGVIGGWMPVGNSGEYEVAHVELYRGSTAAVPGCATSQHLASSEGDFGIMVWGTDYYASYGYPAGGNLKTLNEISVGPAG
jgi:hypothetical protein